MKKVILVLAMVLGFSLFFACNSTPAADTVEIEPTVEEVVEEVLDEPVEEEVEAEE